MDEVFQELLNRVLVEKEIIEKLIAIDNKRNFSNITFDDFYNNLSITINNDNDNVNVVDSNTLFITEGSPYLTAQILKSLVNTREYVIFINQGFVALNEWLVARYKKLMNNEINVTLDIDINYNKYIKNKKYKVLPLGEKELIKQVKYDFEGE